MHTEGTRLPYAITDLIPHRPPYVLLDHVVAATDDTLHARALIARDSFLLQDGRATPIYGIELIAQAIAVYAGLQTLRTAELAGGRPPPAGPGFIVSCRAVTFADVAELPLETVLDIHIQNRWGGAAFGQFTGRVLHAERRLVEAELGVYGGDTSGVFVWQDEH